MMRARSLGPLVRTRAIGMTPREVGVQTEPLPRIVGRVGILRRAEDALLWMTVLRGMRHVLMVRNAQEVKSSGRGARSHGRAF
jgi:hypothetical protein